MFSIYREHTMKILITGASGLIGTKVTQKLLNQGHRLVLLGRDPIRLTEKFGPSVTAFAWDATRDPIPNDALSEVEAIIHLVGETIGTLRWSAETKRAILDSRIKSGQAIAQASQSLSPRLKTLISASAVGIYGNRGNDLLTENSEPGSGFLSDVCQKWESAVSAASADRTILLRFGIVLSEKGGALSKMLPPFKLGVGGRLGSGEQWMSWIHVDDLVEMILWALQTSSINGVFNATSPEPVTNQRFTEVLASTLRRPALLPVPAIALKLALGEMAEETLLVSQRAVPERAQTQGFTFQYPSLVGALENLLS